MDYISNLPIIKNIDLEAFSIKINEIDFIGQEKCESLYKNILRISLILAIICSFYTQQMKHGMFIIIAGFLISVILCLPAWSCFKKNPLKWQEFKEENKKW